MVELEEEYRKKWINEILKNKKYSKIILDIINNELLMITGKNSRVYNNCIKNLQYIIKRIINISDGIIKVDVNYLTLWIKEKL
ncbi:hypothetical protein LCGC14_0923330 [marine sediment metagenome]|uniref:Uncharacterized protein n=1 Tax=marine sediment metagenome TaxID=412755 RepID=A0A0F9RWP3_9ZZZZ